VKTKKLIGWAAIAVGTYYVLKLIFELLK